MKRLRNWMMILGLMAGIAAFVAPVQNAQAIDVFNTSCKGNGSTKLCKSKGDSATKMVKNIINLLIYIVGVVSVIMIVVGGLKYTTSGGDQAGLTSAKNTIMYSVIGLVVAIMSFAIVNFVISKL